MLILGEMVSVFNDIVTLGFELCLADAVISIARCYKTFRSAQQISLCFPCTYHTVLNTEPMLVFSHSCDPISKAFCCLNPDWIQANLIYTWSWNHISPTAVSLFGSTLGKNNCYLKGFWSSRVCPTHHSPFMLFSVRCDALVPFIDFMCLVSLFSYRGLFSEAAHMKHFHYSIGGKYLESRFG